MKEDPISETSLFALITSSRIPQPPAARLLGPEIVSAARGKVTFNFRADLTFLIPAGIVQGGFLSAMLDEVRSITALAKFWQMGTCSH